MRRCTAILVSACLLLALAGCGNKGPLQLPDEEKPKKTRSTTNY